MESQKSVLFEKIVKCKNIFFSKYIFWNNKLCNHLNNIYTFLVIKRQCLNQIGHRDGVNETFENERFFFVKKGVVQKKRTMPMDKRKGSFT